MGQPLEVHIRRLQEFYWSDADAEGRGFVPLADALRRAGDLREAHRLLREGLGRHPDYPSGHIVAGWLSQDQGLLTEAESRFRTALELDSRNVAALRGLAEVLLDQGEKGTALEFLELLSREDPIDLALPARVLELRATIQAEEGEEPESVGEPTPPLWEDPERVAEELDWESAILQPDASAGDVPRETEVEVEAGDTEEAGEEEEAALVTSTLGEIYLRQGLADQAEGVFNSLLEEDPENEHLKHRLEEARKLKGTLGLELGGGEEKEVRVLSGMEDDPIRLTPPMAEDDLPTGEQAWDLVKEAVPIESLAPDRIDPISIAELAPEGVVSADALGPVEAVPVDTLASEEVAPVDALAPEPASIGVLAPDEPVSISFLAPDEPISISFLAPDEPVPVSFLAPDGPIPIGILAPDGPVPIELMAPDNPPTRDLGPPSPGGGGGGDTTVDAFERWLDRLE